MRATVARGFMSLSQTRCFRIIDLTSAAPRTTVPAATVPLLPPFAGPQLQPAGVPNPSSGQFPITGGSWGGEGRNCEVEVEG